MGGPVAVLMATRRRILTEAFPGTFVPIVACLLVVAGLAVSPAQAQSPHRFSMNDLTLDWLRGNYATPVVCRIAGGVHRGLRRILIVRGPKAVRPPVSIVRFVDLEVDDAERCFTEIGGATPNIFGELRIRHAANRPRDTAMRDFKVAIKRERGFDFDIISGKLEFRDVGLAAQPGESIDFRGGSLGLHQLREGSDGLRLLKDLPSPRQALLEIETRDGRRYSFPVSMSKPKPDTRPGARGPARR